MEIDLNHAVETEVEKKNACSCKCNGECDKGGSCGCPCVYCSLSSSTSSCSSNASSSSPISPSKMFMELWYSCAGPVTSLPKKGNVVVYFPQGHLEQASSVSTFPALEVPTFDLQPQIFCKVLEVELLVSTSNKFFSPFLFLKSKSLFYFLQSIPFPQQACFFFFFFIPFSLLLVLGFSLYLSLSHTHKLFLDFLLL